MPETARVLQFRPPTKERIRSSAEVEALAREYLQSDCEDRALGPMDALMDPDVVLVLAALNSLVNMDPKRVAGEATKIYQALTSQRTLGLFDERDYFMGKAALIAGSAYRLQGCREDAEIWLDRAEASVRHVINPAPALARLAYARLTLHYDCARYQRALEELPSLSQSFLKLGMEKEALKSGFLEAMSLKNLSRTGEARAKFEALAAEPELTRDPGLRGNVLLNLGDIVAQGGDKTGALAYYRQSLPLLQVGDQSFGVAHLKGLVGELLREEGQLNEAVVAFRDAIQEYARLEMMTWVAYLRIVLAETLIALARHREAEWEIRMALPTIEEQRMVPEGFAAISLLRESVSRRQADPAALRSLRDLLRANR